MTARRRDIFAESVKMAEGSREGERGITRDKFGGEMRHGDETARQGTFERGKRRRAKAPMPIGDKTSNR